MKKILTILVALSLSACANSNVNAAKEIVRSEFKDSDSVTFKDVSKCKSGIVTGEVNAKNGFGAYTGYQYFIVGDKDTVLITEDPTLFIKAAQAACPERFE